MLRRAVVGIVGVLALVLSPFYGCHAETRFDYDEDDMRAAVEGTWVLRVPATETAAAREITFTLTQASKVARRGDDGIFSVRAASACSSRTFVRPAHACIDSTTMPLDVEVRGAPDHARRLHPDRAARARWRSRIRRVGRRERWSVPHTRTDVATGAHVNRSPRCRRRARTIGSQRNRRTRGKAHRHRAQRNQSAWCTSGMPRGCRRRTRAPCRRR
jgi:hypothetical protein